MLQEQSPHYLLDVTFKHSEYSASHQTSKHIRWIRGRQVHRFLRPWISPVLRFLFNSGQSSVVFVTDKELTSPRFPGKKHVAWLLEPPSIDTNSYTYIARYSSKFDVVLTFNAELLKLGSPFLFYPFGGCWIKPTDWCIYKKTRTVSIIASEKRDTEGHQLRHEVIEKTGRNDLALFGRGYRTIPYKLEALKDFRFSFVIENSRCDYYFTEKLIDCLVTGTIPVYFGCPSIGKFFNTDGFLFLNDINDLEDIEDKLTEELYLQKLPAVQENFQLAQRYALAEDWIFENTDVFSVPQPR